MLSLTGKIVVVEDDASIRGALERILRISGFAAVTFPSAETLLDAHTEVRAACLILDVHLPEWNGFELYDCLVRMGNAPPAIFVTAHDEPESRRQAAAVGAFYFVKPFMGRDLVNAVTRATQDWEGGQIPTSSGVAKEPIT